MNEPTGKVNRTAIREALGRIAYDQDHVRLAKAAIAGFDWLVASHRGIYAVRNDSVEPVVHGWFFGLCRTDGHLFVFENCGHRDRESYRGRIVRFAFDGRTLSAPRIIVRGLHTNCHQVRVIDGLLCVVDTANQAIRRYTPDGEPVDVRRPFPIAPPTDRSGIYLHVNSIAKVAGRVGLILHNGAALPEQPSEIAWLDESWQVEERQALPGHHCHDIVEDECGRLWHSLSREGDVMRSDGVRISITSERMTRGIALRADAIAIGTSTFGPRHLRGALNGSVVVLDRDTMAPRYAMDMPAAPTDIIPL
jgi:hypothetical protein